MTKPHSYTQSVHTGGETLAHKKIQQALQNWIAATSTGSHEAIMKLYDPSAILLPTFSSRPRKSPDECSDYFDFLTALPNIKAIVTDNDIQVFGDTAVACGLYTFSFTENGVWKEAPARFTLVYRKTPQGWLIVNHHSSLLPKD